VNIQEWGFSSSMECKWNVVKEERRKRKTSGKIKEERGKKEEIVTMAC